VYLNQLTEHVVSVIERRRLSALPLGVPSGVSGIDGLIGGGWERQKISYLLADSGKGKSWLTSSFALRAAEWIHNNPGLRPESGYIKPTMEPTSIWEQVANKENKPPIVVLWQLEMAEMNTGVRLITQATYDATKEQIDSALLRRGIYTDKDIPVLNSGMDYLNELGANIWVEFNARSLTDIAAVLNALSVTHDVVLVIVDYFRLIEEVALDGGAATRQEQVSKKLKEIAKCYDCHVMSIFDMNKEGQRETIPSALAMKGGSAAQYDADIIMTMAWDESMKIQGAYYAPEGEAHIVLRTIKNRDGEQGRVDLYINLATGYVKEWR